MQPYKWNIHEIMNGLRSMESQWLFYYPCNLNRAINLNFSNILKERFFTIRISMQWVS